MIAIAATAVVSYLIGAIPFSYIAGRVTKGIDLREHGSGNLGATNTFRLLGGRIAIVVLVLDVAKGFFPVFVAGRLGWGDVPAHWMMLTAMFAAIFGHLYSVYVSFSGGKGIATSAGAFLALAPWAFAGAFTVFVLVFTARRIVSLASLFAASVLPIFVYVAGRLGLGSPHWSYLAVSMAIMVFVIIKHRSNIQRLLEGTEKQLARSKEDV